MEQTEKIDKFDKIDLSLYSNNVQINQRINLKYRRLRKYDVMNNEYHEHSDSSNKIESKRRKKENSNIIIKENNIFSLKDKESVVKPDPKEQNIQISQSKFQGKFEIKVKNSLDHDKVSKVIEDIALFEEEFKEKWKDNFRVKIKSFPIKKSKNVFPKIKFSKKEIIIDKIGYPHEFFFSNFERFIIEIVLSFRSKDKILNNDTKNIGSYTLFYLFKETMSKLLSKYKENLDLSLKKFSIANVIKLKNPINEIYLKTSEVFNKLIKSLKTDYTNLIKLSIKRNETLGDNLSNAIGIEKKALDIHHLQRLKSFMYIDYDKSKLESIFYNNPYYLNIIIRNSKTLNQIRSSIFSSLCEAKLNEIELYKSKENFIKLEQKIYSKIAQNHIYSEDTIDLIIDFLE